MQLSRSEEGGKESSVGDVLYWDKKHENRNTETVFFA